MYTSHPEAIPAQVALAQSETLRSDDLDATATSHGKFTNSRIVSLCHAFPQRQLFPIQLQPHHNFGFLRGTSDIYLDDI